MALVTPFQFWIILGEFLRKQRQSLHFEIRLFDILRFVISAGCLLQSKEERLNHKPLNVEHANAELSS